jgi:hypothetical protein
MPYSLLATSHSPALIIYVLDLSGSMGHLLDGQRRIDVVSHAIEATLQQMVFRCTKGGRVSPRYRVAMLAYSNTVHDIYNGVKTIDQVASFGMPALSTLRLTHTAQAFLAVEQLLVKELPNCARCPAPLVCHMTDGEYTGDDPEPIARRIMAMKTDDGPVLVENIFISDRLLPHPIVNSHSWAGIMADTELSNDYAGKLRAISSPLPESYRQTMLDNGYNLQPGALMMLPGLSPELVEMGFVMSMSTPVS